MTETWRAVVVVTGQIGIATRVENRHAAQYAADTDDLGSVLTQLCTIHDPAALTHLTLVYTPTDGDQLLAEAQTVLRGHGVPDHVVQTLPVIEAVGHITGAAPGAPLYVTEAHRAVLSTWSGVVASTSWRQIRGQLVDAVLTRGSGRVRVVALGSEEAIADIAIHLRSARAWDMPWQRLSPVDLAAGMLQPAATIQLTDSSLPEDKPGKAAYPIFRWIHRHPITYFAALAMIPVVVLGVLLSTQLLTRDDTAATPFLDTADEQYTGESAYALLSERFPAADWEALLGENGHCVTRTYYSDLPAAERPVECYLSAERIATLERETGQSDLFVPNTVAVTIDNGTPVQPLFCGDSEVAVLELPSVPEVDATVQLPCTSGEPVRGTLTERSGTLMITSTTPVVEGSTTYPRIVFEYLGHSFSGPTLLAVLGLDS